MGKVGGCWFGPGGPRDYLLFEDWSIQGVQHRVEHFDVSICLNTPTSVMPVLFYDRHANLMQIFISQMFYISMEIFSRCLTQLSPFHKHL
jgi:hypothetical protein